MQVVGELVTNITEFGLVQEKDIDLILLLDKIKVAEV